MKSHVSALVVGAEVVTPEPVNAEYLDIAGNANRLDDENFGAGTLTAAKLAAGAMHRLRSSVTETSQDVNVEQAISSIIGAVPDDGGEPWVIEVTTYGGTLCVTARAIVTKEATFDLGGGPFQAPVEAGAVWLGLRMNGVMVARSNESMSSSFADTLTCHAAVPAGPGTHVLEVVFGLDTGGEYVDRLTFDDRAVYILEALQ